VAAQPLDPVESAAAQVEAENSQATEDTGTPAAPVSELEVRDPFFQFIIAVLWDDSLGVWSREELQTRMEMTERTSRLPMQDLVSIERRPATGDEVESRRGVKVTRIWILTLEKAMDLPMPYSVFGYHPGSLIISQELRFSEWYLGGPNIHVASDGQVTIHSASKLWVLRLDSGWVILDVDGWLDRLLGKRLDDAWTEGFTVCHIDGELYGLSFGMNRKYNSLYGDFDFRKDEIIGDVRPLSRSLHYYVRPWLAPPEGVESHAWQYER
jgi:hypothetical protein